MPKGHVVLEAVDLIFLGTSDVERMYLGEDLVWTKFDPPTQMDVLYFPSGDDI